MDKFLTFKISQDNPDLQIVFQSKNIKLGSGIIMRSFNVDIASSYVSQLIYSIKMDKLSRCTIYIYGLSESSSPYDMRLPSKKYIKSLFTAITQLNNINIYGK